MLFDAKTLQSFNKVMTKSINRAAILIIEGNFSERFVSQAMKYIRGLDVREGVAAANPIKKAAPLGRLVINLDGTALQQGSKPKPVCSIALRPADVNRGGLGSLHNAFS